MKLLIGVALVPTTLLTSPPAIICMCCHSLASLQVSGGVSFNVASAGNGFDVTISFNFGFILTCMVFDSIMSQNTDAIGFYIGYFGHVTKYACVLHKYPCRFVFCNDLLSIFHDQQSISPHGFVYIPLQHLGASPSANQVLSNFIT